MGCVETLVSNQLISLASRERKTKTLSKLGMINLLVSNQLISLASREEAAHIANPKARLIVSNQLISLASRELES
jgi:hypothetical protein